MQNSLKIRTKPKIEGTDFTASFTENDYLVDLGTFAQHTQYLGAADDERDQQLLRELKLLHRNQTIITGCSSDYSPDQETPFDFDVVASPEDNSGGDAEMLVVVTAPCGQSWPSQSWSSQNIRHDEMMMLQRPAVRPTTLALTGLRDQGLRCPVARSMLWLRRMLCVFFVVNLIL